MSKTKKDQLKFRIPLPEKPNQVHATKMEKKNRRFKVKQRLNNLKNVDVDELLEDDEYDFMEEFENYDD